MDAAQEREVEIIEPCRNRLVCCQHELFDHFVAVGILNKMSPLYFSTPIEVDLDFG